MYIAAMAQKKEVPLKSKPSTPKYETIPLKNEANENYNPIEEAGSRIQRIGKRSDYEAEQKLKKLQELSKSDKRVIETLITKNKILKKELAQKEEILVALERNYEGLSASVKSEHADLNKLKKEAEVQRNLASDLKEKLKKEQEEMTELVQVNQKQKCEKAKLEQELKSLLIILEETKERQLKVVKLREKENKEHDIELHALKEELLKQTSKVAQLQALMTGEKNMIVELERMRRELKKATDEREDMNQDYRKLLMQKEAIIEANQIALQEFQKNFQMSLHNLQNQAAQSEEVAMSKDDEIRQEKMTSRNLMERIKELEREIARYKADLGLVEERHKEEIKKQMQEIEKVELSKKKVEQEVERLKQELKIAEERVKERESGGKEISNQLKLILQQNNELKECMKALQNQNSLLKKTYEQILQRERAEKGELEAQNKELQKAIDLLEKKMKGDLKHSQEQSMNFEQKMKEYERLNEMIKREASLKNSELSSAKKQLDSSADDVTKLKVECQNLKHEKKKIRKIVERLLESFDSIGKCEVRIDGSLCCLSCLQILRNPLLLKCGHAICLKCQRMHGDSGTDSYVFCEQCKIKTKNTDLQTCKLLAEVSDKFNYSRKCADDIAIAVQET